MCLVLLEQSLAATPSHKPPFAWLRVAVSTFASLFFRGFDSLISPFKARKAPCFLFVYFSRLLLDLDSQGSFTDPSYA